MNAIIKKDFNLEKLKDFGFKLAGNTGWFREIKHPVYLAVDKPTRHLVVVTPYGEAAFIESHKDKFQDLLNAKIVEFVEGEFDGN